MINTEEITSLTQLESIDNIDKKEHLASRLIFFIAIYILLNYFILSELYSFLGITKNNLFTFLLVLLSFSYVLGAAALRYSDNLWAKMVSVAGSIWLGVIVLASTTFLIIEFLLYFQLINSELRLLLSFLIILALSIFSISNAMFIRKKIINIKHDKIKKNIRIVQLSDLHIGAAHTDHFLEDIVKRVNDEKPDITIITGDLIDGKHKYKEGYFDVLKKIKSKVYMITGNHERMTGMHTVNDLLKNSDVIMLRNEQVVFDDLLITGIDDTDKPNMMIRTLKKMTLDENKFNILLFHRPNKFNAARKLGVNLMLAGHTHAGQIFPLNLILRFFYRKVQGLKKKKDSYLYVSPGTGWWGPPMRLGSSNEITIFNLEKK